MNRTALLGIGAGLLVVGFLAGYIVGYPRGLDAAAALASRGVTPPAPAAAAPPAAAPPGMSPTSPVVPTPEALQRIEMDRRTTMDDPKNRRAWVQLGNDYFDSHQPQKAIEAYGRALELDPKDPDVLTDQGVMYRDAGAIDKAITNFEKASRIDPHHAQSLFNLGVVYAHDKQDVEKAVAAWRKVVEVAPQSPQAAQARQALETMGRMQPGR